MKIAMLARNPNLYSHRRLQQAAEDRGHQFDILNTLRCTCISPVTSPRCSTMASLASATMR